MGVSDAQALHRRLEEMNQRWVSLMTKSMEIRYGLCTVCVCVERYRLYCMCVVESMENTHKYLCASIFLDLMKITFSRIHRFVDNDTFNTISY